MIPIFGQNLKKLTLKQEYPDIIKILDKWESDDFIEFRREVDSSYVCVFVPYEKNKDKTLFYKYVLNPSLINKWIKLKLDIDTKTLLMDAIMNFRIVLYFPSSDSIRIM